MKGRSSVQRGVCAAVAVVFVILSNVASAQDVSPAQLRELLVERVGDLELLRVPASDADLPQPRLEDGSVDPLYAITPEKVYLGKLLFHDPIRSTDVYEEVGGNPDFRQTASCSSCHLGLAGSKAGQQINFGVGGQGRVKMTADGSWIVERDIHPDAVDAIPTGVILYDELMNPILDGAEDEVDSVPRLSPSVVGLAFNVRLLWDGAAGETNSTFNVDELPAAENIVQLASKNHRMFDDQHLGIQENAVYRQLFADAFPVENEQYNASGDLDDLINADTIQRAIAAFMRATITRDTPWDRFLAGDDDAMSPTELRGAYLFAADVNRRGADCIACHSGPALNKVLGDERGELLSENFFNVGLNEHPLQDRAREVLNDPDHHDFGRMNVTYDTANAFEFKTPTLRQLKNSGPFMHSGELETLRDVVEYFNSGVPSNPQAAQAATLTPLFTNPRGEGVQGLGLRAEDIDALVAFIETGLFDPGFVAWDPESPTMAFDPTAEDLDYSDELVALGAVRGFLPSLMAIGNDDPMTRGQTIFSRGNVNGDESFNIADSVFVLRYLFAQGPEPISMGAADMNGDSSVNVSDAAYGLNFLFAGGPPPPAPFPNAEQLMF